MVDPRKCKGESKPATTRPCNRQPCPGYWKETGWSDCTVTCGNPEQGSQTQKLECEPTNEADREFYDCSSIPKQVPETRICQNLTSCPDQANDTACEGDASPICADEVMKRYCVVPSYFQLCCKSCASHKPFLIYV